MKDFFSVSRFLDFGNFLLFSLALFLPWHGAITVFFPSYFRFWKEGVFLLFALFCFFLFLFFRKKISVFRPYWVEIFAGLFLLWLLILVCVHPDFSFAFLSARYLGIGFLVFLFSSFFFRFFSASRQSSFLILFSRFLIGSVFVGVLWGIWAEFFGGFEILSQFYSSTISSWVPGQTLPLYHLISENPRMQGGASGPIEFALFLCVALFLIPFAKIPRWVALILSLFFFFGILETASRAALVLFFVGGICFFWHSFFVIRDLFFRSRWGKIIFWTGVMSLCMIPFLFLDSSFFTRAGTSDHFTRPVEAIVRGVQHPFLGHLAQAGPAARSFRLQKYNNDQAFIAENVFADYFFQLGFLGLMFALFFWWFLWKDSLFFGKLFVVLAFLFVQTATIFDMTPISLLFFLVFAFFLKKSTNVVV